MKIVYFQTQNFKMSANEPHHHSIWMEDPPYLLCVSLLSVGETVTDLVCQWFRYCENDLSFKLVQQKNTSLVKAISELQLFGCDHLVLDSARGCRRPYFCLLSQKQKEQSTVSMVTLYTTTVADDRLESFETPENAKTVVLANASCDSSDLCDFHFMDGPLSVWRGDKYVYFMSRQASTNKFHLSQVRVKKMIKDHVSDPNNVIILAMAQDRSDARTMFKILLQARNEGNFLFYQIGLDDNKVTLCEPPISNTFSAIVKRVLIAPAGGGGARVGGGVCVEGGACGGGGAYGGDGGMIAIVLTIDHDLLWFHDGRLKHRLRTVMAGNLSVRLLPNNRLLVSNRTDATVIDIKRTKVGDTFGEMSVMR